MPENGTDLHHPISAPQVSRTEFRGRLESLKDRTLAGWAFDAAEPERHLDVEVMIDGRVVGSACADKWRADLGGAGIGDGTHAFVFAIAKHEFDSSTKILSARIAGTDFILPCRIPPTRFDEKFGSDVLGQVTHVQGGQIRGFARHHRQPHPPLRLRVERDGVAGAEVIADQTATIDEEGTARTQEGGFSYRLAQDDVQHILHGRLRFVEPDEDVRLIPAPAILKDVASLEVGRTEDRIARARILIAPGLDLPVAFDVFIDDALYDTVAWTPENRGENHGKSVPVYIDTDVPDSAVVRVKISGSGIDIKDSGQPIAGSLPRTLIANGQFDAWDDEGPRGWSRHLPEGVHLLKTYNPVLPSGLRGLTRNALRFQANDAQDLSGARIAQSLPPRGFRSARTLHVLVAGSAERPSTLEIGCRLLRGGEDRHVTARTVEIGTGFDTRSLMFQIPEDAEVDDARIELAWTGTTATFAELNFVAVGAPGFDAQATAPRPAPARAGEKAVTNGDFRAWSGPFQQTMTDRALALGPSWEVSGKQASPDVELRLCSLTTRDIRLAQAGTWSYGLSLRGDISGKYLRLSSDLRKDVLAECSDLELSLYLVRASSGGEPPNPKSPSRIGQISLIVREHGRSGNGAASVVDKTLAVLARNIDVEQTGRRLFLKVSRQNADLIVAWARKHAPHGEHSIILSFEWHGAIDCTLTDIALASRGAPGTDHAQAYRAFEDFHISDQLGALKGFDDWRRPSGVGAPIRERGETRLPARWTWPARPHSVDIVIPVYNALDDALACLASLEAHTAIPHRVIVVDDASEANVGAALERYAAGRPWMEFIRNQDNIGYTRSSNKGMAAARAEWVVLLNSDTIVTPHWIERLLETAEARPSAAMIGPLSNAASWQSVPEIHDSRGKWCVNRIPEHLTLEQFSEMVCALSSRRFPTAPLLNGFCTLIRRDALEAIGYLDETTFPVGYGEENDLCIRMTGAGYDLVIADHAFVYHAKSASFGTARRDQLSKAGNESLKRKHPHYDFRIAQQALAEAPGLTELRVALRAHLNTPHREPARP